MGKNIHILEDDLMGPAPAIQVSKLELENSRINMRERFPLDDSWFLTSLLPAQKIGSLYRESITNWK